MAKLVIRRRKDTAAVRLPIDVYLDESLVASVRRGQRQSVDIPPGVHAVCARTEHYGSDTVEIHPRQSEEVLVEVWMSILSLGRATDEPHRAISITSSAGTLRKPPESDPIGRNTSGSPQFTWDGVRCAISVVVAVFGLAVFVGNGLFEEWGSRVPGLIWGAIFAVVGVLDAVTTGRRLVRNRGTDGPEHP